MNKKMEGIHKVSMRGIKQVVLEAKKEVFDDLDLSMAREVFPENKTFYSLPVDAYNKLKENHLKKWTQRRLVKDDKNIHYRTW